METKTTKSIQWSFASIALTDAWTDFILSRQAMNVTRSTLEFYKYTAGKFLTWLESQGVTRPDEISALWVRQYLAELKGKDTSKHDHARAIRTLLRFWHEEGYIAQLIKFDMPRLEKKRLPTLTGEQLKQVLSACNTRDKAILLFMADSGLRRQEVINLNWSDVDIQSGLIRVTRGKGKKDRSAVIGAVTRRALLAYRRTLKDRDGVLFQNRSGNRFTGPGLLRVFQRLSKQTGIHTTPHALRRTFVILSLRSGMDPLHLQALLGHADLSMVAHYAQMVDDDLLQAHKEHSPIDSLGREGDD